MSDRLALSSALSVLIMAAYVLLGSNAVQAPLGPHALVTGPAADRQLMPQVSVLVDALR
jgi:hypothetical protein